MRVSNRTSLSRCKIIYRPIVTISWADAQDTHATAEDQILILWGQSSCRVDKLGLLFEGLALKDLKKRSWHIGGFAAKRHDAVTVRKIFVMNCPLGSVESTWSAS